MRKLGVESIQNIAIGAALMGAGGGGNPFIGKLMAINAVRRFGPVTLLGPDELADDAVVSSPSSIGAPAVSLEKFPNGCEFKLSLDKLQEVLGKKISALFPVEAGGINSMIPLIAGAQLNLPVVDADAMGRAFPELQMSTLVLAGHKICPIVMSDEKGNLVVINTDDPKSAEKFARAITVQMGATAQSASDTTTGKGLREDGVTGIITLCESIGKLLSDINQYDNVNDALQALLDLTDGYRMMTAKIVDVHHVTKGGFNFGTVILEGLDDDQNQVGKLEFQNENIVFQRDDMVLATSPDLISLVDEETLMPITNEELYYGKRVFVLGIPCNSKWRTPAGIKSVSPRYFKYDLDYKPVEMRIKDFLSKEMEAVQ
ncbi:DUF917 domain-containing protein [Oenococcus sp. UCMA 16435]|nr:DUF917 domain-containing protein [Oenococcus sp. UCMA 16435]